MFNFKKSEGMTKADYESELLKLRTELIKVQYAFKEYKRPMILILSGMDGAGKGELVNFLADIMDTRLIETSTFWQESDEESERPYYFRFWNRMPAGGKLGIYFNGWYDRMMRKNIDGGDDDIFIYRLREAADFEKMLCLDGGVVVKVWGHIPKDEQKKRHDKLKKKGKAEAEKRALWHQSQYDDIMSAFEHTYRYTHTEFAPWEILDCSSKRDREIGFLKIILKSMKTALEGGLPSSEMSNLRSLSFPDKLGELEQESLDGNYRKQLDELVEEIKPMAWEAYDRGLSTMLLFEGWDAGGKGGAIRRLLRSFDMRLTNVISVAAPTSEELARHYLWRFWRHVPRAGHISIFDRSWYGRVLVERIEGYAKESEWFRSYDEINDFEKHLHDRGIMLMKFFLHITMEEQLKRFKQREEIPWKQHKITEEDYRNRDKSGEYADAYNEMFFKTDTQYARWNIIPAGDKKFSRIAVLKCVKKALADRLK